MKRIVVFAFVFVLTLSVAAPAEPTHRCHSVDHDFADAEHWAQVFEAPDRRLWQRPDVLLRFLGVVEGQRVADLGAGTGYFTSRLSQLVDPGGKVYAVDVEPAMLDYIRQRKDVKDNVETVLAAPDDPELPDGNLDLILVVDTWHHIGNHSSYIPKLRRALTTGGRVAIVDWREGDLPEGPPAGSKLERGTVVGEFERAGWRLVSESVALPYQYVLVFAPPIGG